MELFINDIKQEEIFILNNQQFKADLAYQNICKQAIIYIIIIDDNISIKTLKHLSSVKDTTSITIILDNDTSKMKVYLSGSSIKDSGNTITTIIQIKDIDKFRQLINVLLTNPILTL